MNVLDYIVLALFIASTVFGFFKGFFKQILTVIGVIVVATLTATVSPYVQNWFVSVIDNENTRTVIAMIVTVILLIAIYSLAATLLQRVLKKINIVKVVDKLLGGLIGFAVVYFACAVIFALFLGTSDAFLPLLKSKLGDSFQNSWIGTHIYGNNFFGDWVINGIAEKILQSLQPAA